MKPKDLSEAVGFTKRFDRIVSLRQLLADTKSGRFAVQTVLGELGEDVSDEACQEIARTLEKELYRLAVGYRNDLAGLGVDINELKVPPPRT